MGVSIFFFGTFGGSPSCLSSHEQVVKAVDFGKVFMVNWLSGSSVSSEGHQVTSIYMAACPPDPVRVLKNVLRIVKNKDGYTFGRFCCTGVDSP